MNTSVRTTMGYGDLDADGDIDMVANAPGPVVALNMGNRLFGSPETRQNFTYEWPLLAVHDLNGDGLGDLVHEFGVYLGLGGGAFSDVVVWGAEAARPVSFKGESGFFALREDKLSTSFVYIDRINADGSLSSVAQVGLPSSSDLKVADFDGDGLTDIAAVRPSSIQIAWNLGGFRFELSSWFGTQQDHLGIADLNGDGAQELVGLTRGRLALVSFANRKITSQEISTGVMVRTESGGPSFWANGGPHFAGYDDRDGDGWKDLVFVGGDGFLVLWGAPARPFESSSSYYSPGMTRATLVDLDGDALLDLVPLVAYPPGPRIVWGSSGSRDLGPGWDLSFETDLSRDMVSRDFNGDGVPDLMRTLTDRQVAGTSKGLGWGVDVLLGDGRGGFDSSFVYRKPRGSGSIGQALTADLDRDGHLDVTLSTFHSLDGVHAVTDVLFGNGDGTFRLSSLQVTGLVPLATGAVRSDGGDALVMRRDQALFLMWIDDGAVVLESIHELPSGDHASVVAIDLDGDGRDEIILSYEYDFPRILKRMTTGWISQKFESESPGLMRNVHAADFTGDGRGDLVVNSGGIHLLEATEGGYVRSYLHGTYSSWSMIDDIENDGDLDLLVVGMLHHVTTINLYLNDGSGKFQLEDSIDIPDTTYYQQGDIFALIDMDGDGYKDLVTHYGEILFNRCRQSSLRGTAHPARIWSGQEATLYFKGSRFLTTARISRDGVRVAELTSADNSLFGGFTWRTGPLYTGIHTFDIDATGYNDGRAVSEGTRIVIEVLPEIPRRRAVRR